MRKSQLLARSRRALVGVVAITISAGFLVQASALQSSAAQVPVPDVSEQNIDANRAQNRRITIDVDNSRVSLFEGRVRDVHGDVSKLYDEIEEGLTPGVLDVNALGYTDATVTYRVTMLGVQTPYSVKFTSYNWESNVGSSCGIYEGDPYTGKLAEPSPFTCQAVEKNFGLNHRVRFHIALNRSAEASGTIAPQDVSLAGGTFFADRIPYLRRGDSTVASGQSTSFDAVLRESDKPFYENQARTEWAYEIVDEGKKTGVWVAGVSTNYRGKTWFSGDGRCAFYKSNPIGFGAHLDYNHPIEQSKYYCSAEGDYVHGPGEDGRGHYHATFSVGRQ